MHAAPPPVPPQSPPPSARRRGLFRRFRGPWQLRTRLVVSAVSLIAVVCAVIGTVTAIALHSYLQGQLDDDLRTSVIRADGMPAHGHHQGDDLLFITAPGHQVGTVGARLAPGGQIVEAARSNDSSPTSDPADQLDRLTNAQVQALSSVPRDGRVHGLDLPGLGGYRAIAGPDGSVLLAFPLTQVQDTMDTLIVVEVCVTASGLVAAGIAGAAMVGFSLRPLRRVAVTATRVSELPLHSGEVALHERVPEPEADPRTEVGQVGAALNRMLGHVGSALAARQESETRVRQFVADASHELRTPLASIRGYAELTRRGPEDIGPDTRHALGRIESEASRMTGLVEDLLLLARLDAGRPLSSAEVDLLPLVVDAVSDARAAGPGHRWRLDLPDDPALVYGDDNRLHQVLVNLLANARTHTPDLTTVVARVLRRGPWVSLEIQDDGPGIPPDLLPHVFERFARGDASRSRPGAVPQDGPTDATDASAGPAGRAADADAAATGGAAGSGPPGGAGRPSSTGLGLAIVQAVVTAHGGWVTVDSVPGRTVFGVHLPAAPPDGAAWPGPGPDPRADRPCGPPPGPGRTPPQVPAGTPARAGTSSPGPVLPPGAAVPLPPGAPHDRPTR